MVGRPGAGAVAECLPPDQQSRGEERHTESPLTPQSPPPLTHPLSQDHTFPNSSPNWGPSIQMSHSTPQMLTYSALVILRSPFA